MAGNQFGSVFKITTFGESHGPAIGVIIDGCPAGLALSDAVIQRELDRRRPGQSGLTTPRNEADQVEILSGIFLGVTTGTPIAMMIRNTNVKSDDYKNIESVYRPGHADFTFDQKFGRRDFRGGGRSSGRETAARVAAGAVAKAVLQHYGVAVLGYTSAVGLIQGEQIDFDFIDRNPVRAADPSRVDAMIAEIEAAKAAGDSVGGVVSAVITGCPVGLGDPVFDKLDARLAHAMVSIGTIKGIEFGSGFGASQRRGSENNDAFCVRDGVVSPATNRAGGILGGISTGEPIEFRVAVKPPSSISTPQSTVDQSGHEIDLVVRGRHDPCICPRVVPVVEAMAALVIVDALLIQRTVQLGKSG